MLDSYESPKRPSVADAAVLVALDFGERDHADAVAEFRLLCGSAGLTETALVGGKRAKPDPAYYAGSGKVGEIAAAVAATGAQVVVFNHMLSPAQQRNLEGELKARVIDRTTLILDIFAQRAQSHEGKIQVELAQLRHLATRLVRGWTHLERQKGGIGLRGPGETQLETDRRLLGKRVKTLSEKLEKLQRQRAVQRRARSRGRVFSVSLVGYTNAGKSTLFNSLTKAQTYAADQLFATLDTTSRKIHLPGAGNIVVSDTVGFIRDLPHALVAAFRATLEETVHADLLLHVVDSASPARLEQVEQVNAVLEEIGAENVPQVLVWNKIDLAMGAGADAPVQRPATPMPGLPDAGPQAGAQAAPGAAAEGATAAGQGARYAPGIERDEYDKISRVYLSARTREGIDFLRQALTEHAVSFAAASPGQDPTADVNGASAVSVF